MNHNGCFSGWFKPLFIDTEVCFFGQKQKFWKEISWMNYCHGRTMSGRMRYRAPIWSFKAHANNHSFCLTWSIQWKEIFWFWLFQYLNLVNYRPNTEKIVNFWKFPIYSIFTLIGFPWKCHPWCSYLHWTCKEEDCYRHGCCIRTQEAGPYSLRIRRMIFQLNDGYWTGLC